MIPHRRQWDKWRMQNENEPSGVLRRSANHSKRLNDWTIDSQNAKKIDEGHIVDAREPRYPYQQIHIAIEIMRHAELEIVQFCGGKRQLVIHEFPKQYLSDPELQYKKYDVKNHGHSKQNISQLAESFQRISKGIALSVSHWVSFRNAITCRLTYS
jgi:hypothetical protein